MCHGQLSKTGAFNYLICGYDTGGMNPGYFCYQFNGRKVFGKQIKMYHFGAMLGSQGAFDKDTGNHYSGTFDSGDMDNIWRDFCEDGSEYGIDPEDYPNQRRYDAAYTLANEFRVYADEEDKQKEDARCRFILECADHVLAANYLSNEDGFLYAQAIKDHFTLPCSLPDEDATREMQFFEIINKIARYDIPLSLEIWAWCLQEFYGCRPRID